MRSVNRRTFAIGSIVAAPAIVAAVRTQAQESTPPAVASPEASPGASPAASPVAGGGGGVTLNAVDIAWEPKDLQIPANTDVVVTIVNQGVLQHDFAVEELGVSSDVLNGGQTGEVTINAPAGTYEFICTVPGHAEAGMVGTLTVA